MFRATQIDLEGRVKSSRDVFFRLAVSASQTLHRVVNPVKKVEFNLLLGWVASLVIQLLAGKLLLVLRFFKFPKRVGLHLQRNVAICLSQSLHLWRSEQEGLSLLRNALRQLCKVNKIVVQILRYVMGLMSF